MNSRSVACAILTFVMMPTVAISQAISEPGGNAQGIEMALTKPDDFAWQLFMYLNRPAVDGKAGVADSNRKLGDASRSVVWETWALSSGGDVSETYPKNGARPVDWDKLDRSSRRLFLDRNLEGIAVRGESKAAKPSARFDPTDPGGQEVRANRAAYEFIMANEMYHVGGLEALQQRAQQTGNRKLISFTVPSKEVKAQWLQIDEAQKQRYFWREAVDGGGNKRIWGLVAFHVITKDLPNWFWADFGHIDCENQQGACNSSQQEPALTDPVDSTTRGPNPPSGSNGVRSETRGTVWENYILRGTQTDFVTPFGTETVLSNPVIENGFQRSSCITCHARASVGERLRTPDGKPVDAINRLSPGDPELGAPNPALVGAGPGTAFRGNQILYLQTDFVWSAPFRAQRQP